MENTKMFKHPSYYKNLRKLYRSRNRNQAISLQPATAASERAPGTGLKQNFQASSDKLSNQPQASSTKPSSLKRQA
jgi:hypothetical protein